MPDEPMRDLKVKIPLQYYVQLHALKILQGQNLTESLSAALEMYFAKPENAQIRKAALDRLR